MNRSRMMLLFAATQPQLTFSGTFPANPYPGQMGVYQKYPTVETLPSMVTDGQSWVVGGVEYLGVGGSWVAQASVTKAVWGWDGIRWVLSEDNVYIGSGDSFPEDAEIGNVFTAREFPIVAKFPLKPLIGQRLNLSSDGIQYLGAVRPRLTIGNSTTFAPPSTTMHTEDWEILIQFSVSSDYLGGYFEVFTVKNSDGKSRIAVSVNPSGIPYLDLLNDGHYLRGFDIGTSSLVINNVYTLVIRKTGNILSGSIGGSDGYSSTTGWVSDFALCQIKSAGASVSPIYLNRITQKLNNIVVDDFLCDEINGTELANAANHLRPATFNGSFGVSWEPEVGYAVKTYTKRSIANNSGATTIAIIGDSISYTLFTYFPPQNKNVSVVVYAVSSQNTDQMIVQLQTALDDGHKVVLWSIFTPNDGWPTDDTGRETYENYLKAIALCRLYNAVLVVSILCPNNTYNENSDPIRQMVVAEGRRYANVSMLEAVNTGTDPDEFAPGMNSDVTHPSALGYTAMSEMFDEKIDAFIAEGLWF